MMNLYKNIIQDLCNQYSFKNAAINEATSPKIKIRKKN